MSGETDEKPSGWTTDTVKHYLEALMREKDLRDAQRFEQQQLALREALISQEKAVNAALSAAQQAVTKAEIAAEKRFDNVNEFRGQLADQAASLMPRNEVYVVVQGINDKIADLQSRLDRGEGVTGGGQSFRDLQIRVALTVAAFLSIAVAVIVAVTR